MRVQSITRLAALGALVAGLACAKSLDTMAKPANGPDETAARTDSTQDTSAYKAGARDTTMANDSAKANQTKSGVVNSSGQSVTGDTVTKTRPDQGQPVTSKGDTINPGVDSTSGAGAGAGATTDSTNHAGMDSSGHTGMDTTTSAPTVPLDTTSSPSDSTR
jgi:hypothetical protein